MEDCGEHLFHKGITKRLLAAHNVQTNEDKSQTRTKQSRYFNLFVLKEAHHNPCKGKKVHEHIEIVVFQCHQHTRHGRTDIGTHNDGSGLHQGHYPCVYQTDHHDRGGGRALNNSGYTRTDANSRETIIADFFQKTLHACTGALFQGIAHVIHTHDEYTYACQQPNQAL